MAIALQRCDDPLEYVRMRLAEWAAWQRALSGVRALTYPSKACHVQGISGSEEIEASEEVQAVEKVMADLKLRQRHLFVVLDAFYRERQNQSIVAQQLRISVPTFKNRRHAGEQYVAGRLGV